MRAATVLLTCSLLSTLAFGQAAKDGSTKGIYTCTTADGRKLTGDPDATPFLRAHTK